MHESYSFNNSVGKVRAVKDWAEFTYLEHVKVMDSVKTNRHVD